MPLHMDTDQTHVRTLPHGPALIYVTEGDNPTVTGLDRADLRHMPRRDRAVCRALLAYVLRGLDEADSADEEQA